MTAEEKRCIKRVAKSQELHLLQLQQQHLQLQLHLKKVREKEKIEQKKKETQALVDSFFSKAPKVTRSLSLPERRAPVKDDISKIIDELAQDASNAPHEFNELYEETKRELRQQKRFVEKRPSVTDIALTLENVAPNAGVAIHNFAAEVLDSDGLEHSVTSGQFADASAHEEALFTQKVTESRQEKTPTKPEYMVDLVMGDGGRMEVVLTETDRNYRHRPLSPPIHSDEPPDPTSSSSENKGPEFNNIDDVSRDDADSLSSCSVETQIASNHFEFDRDISEIVTSEGCDEIVRNELAGTEVIPIGTSHCLKNEGISEREYKSEVASGEVSSSSLPEIGSETPKTLFDSKEGDNKPSHVGDETFGSQAAARPQPSLLNFEKEAEKEVSSSPQSEIAIEPPYVQLDIKGDEEKSDSPLTVLDQPVVRINQNRILTFGEETMDSLARHSNSLELQLGDVSQKTENQTTKPGEALHEDNVGAEMTSLQSAIPRNEDSVFDRKDSLKHELSESRNEVNHNNKHSVSNSEVVSKLIENSMCKEEVLPTNQNELSRPLIASVAENHQKLSDIPFLQDSEPGDKIFSDLRQLSLIEDVITLTGDNTISQRTEATLETPKDKSQPSSNGHVELQNGIGETDKIDISCSEILPVDSENVSNNSALKPEKIAEVLHPLPLALPQANGTAKGISQGETATNVSLSSKMETCNKVLMFNELSKASTSESTNIAISSPSNDVPTKIATFKPQNEPLMMKNEIVETPNETNVTPYLPLGGNSQVMSFTDDVRIENIPPDAQPKSATSEIPDQCPESDGESQESDSEGKSGEDEVYCRRIEADRQNVLQSPPHQIAGFTSAEPSTSTERRDSAKDAFWVSPYAAFL